MDTGWSWGIQTHGKHAGAYDIDECEYCVTCNVIKATGRHAAAWIEF